MNSDALNLAHPRRAVLKAAALSLGGVGLLAVTQQSCARAVPHDPSSASATAATSDITAKIQTALANSDNVTIPAGTFTFDGLVLPNSRTLTIELDPNAKLILNDGVNRPAIIVPSTSTLHLTGGTWDFNASGQTAANCHGVHFMNGGLPGSIVENATLLNAHDNAVYAVATPQGTVRNCHFVNPGLSAVLIDAGPSDIAGWIISGNNVDKSSQAAGTPAAGIRVHGTDGGGAVNAAQVMNNHVLMPANATSPGFIGIEVWHRGGEKAQITGNRLEAGYMGISVDRSTGTTLQNNTILNAAVYSIELAAATGTVVTSNSVTGGQYGMVCFNPAITSYVTATGNYFSGQDHSCVTVADGAHHITLKGNYFDSHQGLQVQVLPQAGADNVLDSNLFDGGARSTGTVGVFAGRGDFSFTNNVSRHLDQAITIANKGQAPSNILIQDNSFEDCRMTINLVGQMGTISQSGNTDK